MSTTPRPSTQPAASAPDSDSGTAACPAARLFWEYEPALRRDPPFEVAAAKITALGNAADIRWLVQRFGCERIKEWLMTSRVIGADRQSVNLMCVIVGADISKVRITPDWTCGGSFPGAPNARTGTCESTESREDHVAQVKIYGHAAFLRTHRSDLSDAIQRSLVATFHLPPEKRFQRFFPMDADTFIHPVDRSASYLIIEIVCFSGRSIETKKALIRSLMAEMGRVGVSGQDLEIVIMESPAAQWGIRGTIGDELTLSYPVNV